MSAHSFTPPTTRLPLLCPLTQNEATHNRRCVLPSPPSRPPTSAVLSRAARPFVEQFWPMYPGVHSHLNGVTHGRVGTQRAPLSPPRRHIESTMHGPTAVREKQTKHKAGWRREEGGRRGRERGRK